MLIGIDGNEANIEKRVGVNVYAFKLLHTLSKLQMEWGREHQLIVYLKRPPLADMPKETQNFRYKILRGKGNWILSKLMPHLLFGKESPNVFLSLSHYVPPLARQPRVCAIMDLGYLKFSGHFQKYDYWQLKLWTAMSLFLSRKVIAISEATKKDIVRHYPFAAHKTMVTPLAYDASLFRFDLPKEDVRRIKGKYSIVGDYILFLSTLKPSKNVERLVEAFGSIGKSFPDLKLVIGGKKGWLYDSIFHKVKSLDLSDRIIFTDFVAEEDKPALMAGAKVFCLPSFWEGFGLDVLNALASGVPVVISDRGSLPEVGGAAATYVNPDSVESIAEGLKKVLSLSELEYNKVVQKGLAQAGQFSWEKTARQTLEIITHAGSKR